MIKKENIQAKAKAKNWGEAIQIVGRLLEIAGSATHCYTEAMITAVKEMGPYMVITPNFALAHAAPSDEVKKDDVALITLDEPVLFGSPNDPVYIIMAICSKDGKSHMNSLTQIANVLMRENTITRLLEAKNADEVFNILEKNEFTK